ncbi:MAG: hypothetical protein WBB23_02115 [Desulforhopalus sp.]
MQELGIKSPLLKADMKHGIDRRLKALDYRYIAVDLAGYRMRT